MCVCGKGDYVDDGPRVIKHLIPSQGGEGGEAGWRGEQRGPCEVGG